MGIGTTLTPQVTWHQMSGETDTGSVVVVPGVTKVLVRGIRIRRDGGSKTHLAGIQLDAGRR